MKNCIKITLSVLFLGMMISCAAKEKGHPPKKKKTAASPQQAVEQAHFQTLNGKDVAVSDFKGKVVLIDFWETWCGPCVKSMPTLNKLQKKYSNRLKILAVTPGFSDTIKDAKAFAGKHNFDFTYLMDSNNLHRKLNVRGIPFKIFIGPDGKFIKKQMGSHGPKGDYQHIEHVVEKYTKAES